MMQRGSDESPLVTALRHHNVHAVVTDLDHYRIHGGMAVETDYIIRVSPTSSHNDARHPQQQPSASSSLDDPLFDSFLLSKSYSAFRTLAGQLKKAVDSYTEASSSLPAAASLPLDAVRVAKYCELVTHLIESQRTQYLGKVNYNYVKVLAKQRSAILNDVLDATCSYFPSHYNDDTAHPLLKEVAVIVELFFLTDHCEAIAVVPTSANTSTKSLGSVKELPVPEDISPVGLTRHSSAATGGGESTSSIQNNNSHHQNHNQSKPTHGRKFSFDTKNIPILGKALAGATLSNNKTPPTTQNTTEQQQQQQQQQLGHRSVVIPMTRKHRRPDREGDEDDLNAMGDEARLLLDDDRSPGINTAPVHHYQPVSKNQHPPLPQQQQHPPSITILSPSYARPKPIVQTDPGVSSKWETIIINNPLVFVAIAIVSVLFLRWAAQARIAVDGDLELLLLFASFCIGLHTPRPLVGGFDRPPMMKASATTLAAWRGTSVSPVSVRADRSGRRLLRRSMIGVVSPRASMIASSVRSQGESLLSVRQSGNVGTASLRSPREEELLQQQQDESILETDFDVEDEDMILGSPLPKLPEGAAVGGEHTNCWSEPDPALFPVRGPKYFSDKKKIPSGEFLFINRGMDLFLTDTCPENVGSNGAVFGGNLRDKPTFVINFRLPWGVLVFYAEIPERFLPFVHACYEPSFDKKKLPDLKKMTPGDRCVARFLMENDDYKNGCLKIVPIVVDGPWVVRQVVGGKPAIIGNKLPINYVYQPAQGDKALYLEADLDVAASSAARYILSVARSYTDCLTLDLGFVVQGNREDELPEQMLTGTRIHRIDPLTAPSLPPMKDLFLEQVTARDQEDDDSVGASK